MVEDAGARADGGDAEAPAEAPRLMGKCGAVRFRNGRFISPVVLDEYLERKSVDAVLREREKEETDPFL